MNSSHLAKTSFGGVLACSLFSLAPQAPAQTTWFPLQPGLRWTYSDESRPEYTRVVTVKRQEGDGFVVDFYGMEAVIHYGYDIDLPGEGPGVYYRFDEDSFLHRDFHSCDDLRILSIPARDEEVPTPAGTYTGCLKVEYEPGPCVDGGTSVEWWAPEVGRVRWTESWIGGERTFVLLDFTTVEPQPAFRRGDVDLDGEMLLGDAVAILDYLFLDGPVLGCADAADVNDDGSEDLSDAVAVIWYLFLNGDPPPAPGPGVCGEDPSKDALPDCQPGPCGPTLIDS